MEHIFISYSHEDSDFADELMKDFEQAGYKTWSDNRNLAYGTNWKQGIDDAIQNAFVIIVVMTADARQSEYVTYEWSYAMGLGVPVIPVVLEKMELHPKLEELQHVNFSRSRAKQLQNLMGQFDALRIQFWVRQLQAPRYPDRIRAVRRLAELDAKTAVTELINVMHTDRGRKSVRPVAADALEKIGTSEALTAVQKWRKRNKS